MLASRTDNTVLSAEDLAALRAHLAALDDASGYAYPDRDNHLEDMVFTFLKREKETKTWGQLVERAFGRERPFPGVALDAGCGLGAYVEPLRSRFAHALFVDADPARVRESEQRFGEPGLRSFFTIALDDERLAAAPLAGRLSFVSCVQVLGHVPTERVRVILDGFARMLRPGGWLLLGVPFTGTPYDEFWITFLDVDARPRPMITDARKYDRLARKPEAMRLPVRHFARETLRALLEESGFDVAAEEPYNWFSDTRGDLFVLAERRP